MQDMLGGKTTATRRFFGFIPFGRPQGFNPYNPYAGMNLAPNNAPQNASYVYGTQQPYNPYNNAPAVQGQQQWYGQQGYQQTQQPMYSGAQPQQPYQQMQQPTYGAQQQPFYQQAQQPTQTGFSAGEPRQELPRLFCGNCGSEQEPGTKYCSMCGSKLEVQ